ncbi:MAG: AarF/ABC1/UbiB kinase family protein [Myxococcales bacterium]|nr:AarF/ABC1/UbiB kinase family protein [Myxococcales bacterium]
MSRWPGYFARFLAIGLVGIACLLLYGLLRLGTLFILDRERRAASVARIRGRLLREAMTLLGATFIKLGQVLSTRPDLIEPGTVDELRKLQDRLPPFSFARARRIIELDLGSPLSERFAEFDPVPVAAASVAQVHRARLADGTEVAVKVLRPDIRDKCVRDGAILLFFARLLALHPTVRLSDPVGHLSAFVAGIVEQTHLDLEADHYDLFRANFRDFEGVHFPRTYRSHSARHVMTMDFLRGRKVDALPAGDHRLLAKRIRDTFFKMCFVDGFVHADLHPGNMMLCDDGRLAIFDVGLVKKMDGSLLDQFVDFARCIAMGKTKDFVHHLRTFHQYLDGVDWPEVERDVGHFAAYFRSQNVAELEMGAFANKLFALGRKHRVRPLPEMTLVLAGVVTSEGLAKLLDPDCNTWQEMATFLLPVLAARAVALPS